MMGGKTVVNSKLISVSKLVLLISVFILPILFSFGGILSITTIKLGIFYGAVLLATILWSISRLKKDGFRFPKNLLFLSIVLILFSSILSSVFSANYFVSIFGSRLSLYTFIGLLLLFASSLLIAALFKNKKNALIATIIVYISLVVTLVINLLYILLDFLPSFGFFLNNSINTVGKWSDLGLISVFVILLSYINLELISKNKFLKISSYVGLVVSIISALIISESMTWIILSIVSVIYTIYKVVILRQRSSVGVNESIPTTPIVVLIISFVMILAGPILSTFTDQYFEVFFSETKPGLQSTLEVNLSSLKQKPLFGYGENLYERAWQQNKNESIILSNYWGTDFVSGYSYLTSVPAKTGLIGLFAWLFFGIVVLIKLFKLLFKNNIGEKENYVSIAHSFSVLFFGFVLLLHVPSTTILILAFVTLGLFIGSLDRNKLYNTKEILIENNPKIGFLYIFAIIALIIVTIFISYMAIRQLVSSVMLERASYNLQIGNQENVGSSLLNSVNIFSTDDQFRALSNYYMIQINDLLAEESLDNQNTVDTFRDLLADSITSAAAAIRFDNQDYVNHINLASIYEPLISLGVEGAYEQSENSYVVARELNPKNPGILVDMARIAYINKDINKAKSLIDEALEIKPQFVNAIYLLSQIQVSEGDIPSAILSVERSISIQPNNSELYFQLGLLKYNDSDFEGAVTAFERSVMLRPLFSNAKYFLGLSYDSVGRKQDAILQFKDLELLNPDSEEVSNILSRLESGQSATEQSVETEPSLEINEQVDGLEELPLEETSE